MGSPIKFITSPSQVGTETLYIGHPQHNRVMDEKAVAKAVSEAKGVSAAKVLNAWHTLGRIFGEYGEKTVNAKVGEVMTLTHNVKGAFPTSAGPWNPAVNRIVLGVNELAGYRDALKGVIPVNQTEGARPQIYNVMDAATQVFDEITGTDLFRIAGKDLALNPSRDDEFVEFLGRDGASIRAQIVSSDLTSVECRLAEPVAATDFYTLRLFTRSGMDESIGVATCSRANIKLIAA